MGEVGVDGWFEQEESLGIERRDNHRPEYACADTVTRRRLLQYGSNRVERTVDRLSIVADEGIDRCRVRSMTWRHDIGGDHQGRCQ